jgi:hypothetical protein
MALLVGISMTQTSPAAAREASPGERLLIAHYYSWFDMNTWGQGVTADSPASPYASADTATMTRHVDAAAGAGIDVFNLAWLGPRNPTDSNFARMLPIAAKRGLSMTIGFETDSPFMGSRGAMSEGLRYVMERYSNQSGYLHYEGKPVIFFWRLGAIPLTGERNAVAAWRSLRDEVDPNREALWIGEGDRFEFLEVFDGIYPYSIAWSPNVAGTLSSYGSRTRAQAATFGAPKLWVATVMPGYDDLRTGRSDAFTRDRQDGGFYDETWNAALGSNPDWISITTWNEWVEGSQIEPSRGDGGYYLDATRSYASSWKGIDAYAFAAPETPAEEPTLEVAVATMVAVPVAAAVKVGPPTKTKGKGRRG